MPSDNEFRRRIEKANSLRKKFRTLRDTVYAADICPIPALEMMIAEMTAIHYCSDIDEVEKVIDGLIGLADERIAAGVSVCTPEAARVFWINPVADLRMMNLLEDCDARLCGTEFMFTHALNDFDIELRPMRAFAAAALSDPMVGPTSQRVERICEQINRYRCEAVVVSRIPGASHCAMESELIARYIREKLDLPVVEIEVPVIIDSLAATLRTRLEALVESVLRRRDEKHIIPQ